MEDNISICFKRGTINHRVIITLLHDCILTRGLRKYIDQTIGYVDLLEINQHCMISEINNDEPLLVLPKSIFLDIDYDVEIVFSQKQIWLLYNLLCSSNTSNICIFFDELNHFLCKYKQNYFGQGTLININKYK